MGKGDVSNESPRDDAVDRLLRTSMRDALPGPTTACVDAETLAAWADGGLPASARTSVEAHVSSCADCQALAAAFARSLPAEPVGSTAGVAPGFWTPWRWGWIAAVATAAAAVTVWVSLPHAGPETPAVQTMASREAVPEPEPLPVAPQAKAESSAPPANATATPAPVAASQAAGRGVATLEEGQ